jgi:hypothetical protein
VAERTTKDDTSITLVASHTSTGAHSPEVEDIRPKRRRKEEAASKGIAFRNPFQATTPVCAPIEESCAWELPFSVSESLAASEAKYGYQRTSSTVLDSPLTQVSDMDPYENATIDPSLLKEAPANTINHTGQQTDKETTATSYAFPLPHNPRSPSPPKPSHFDNGSPPETPDSSQGANVPQPKFAHLAASSPSNSTSHFHLLSNASHGFPKENQPLRPVRRSASIDKDNLSKNKTSLVPGFRQTKPVLPSFKKPFNPNHSHSTKPHNYSASSPVLSTVHSARNPFQPRASSVNLHQVQTSPSLLQTPGSTSSLHFPYSPSPRPPTYNKTDTAQTSAIHHAKGHRAVPPLTSVALPVSKAVADKLVRLESASEEVLVRLEALEKQNRIIKDLTAENKVLHHQVQVLIEKVETLEEAENAHETTLDKLFALMEKTGTQVQEEDDEQRPHTSRRKLRENGFNVSIIMIATHKYDAYMLIHL